MKYAITRKPFAVAIENAIKPLKDPKSINFAVTTVRIVKPINAAKTAK